MDRKEYWNKKYAEYWKAVTDEAEIKDGKDSSINKLSGHDFKAPNIAVITSFFEKITYDKNDKLLDYGCGLGRFYPYFSEKCSYFGIDISQAMIDECVKKYPSAKGHFIVAEGESLPFSDDYFDKVICNGVFDACYQEQALAEMLRVVKSEGVILISGKNDHYYSNDEEAYIAEVNARKKNHPNYFTDVKNMLCQLSNSCEILEQRYALRRGDFGADKFENTIPEIFYEWEIIIRKIKNIEKPFSKFSDMYSKTWRECNS